MQRSGYDSHWEWDLPALFWAMAALSVCDAYLPTALLFCLLFFFFTFFLLNLHFILNSCNVDGLF